MEEVLEVIACEAEIWIGEEKAIGAAEPVSGGAGRGQARLPQCSDDDAAYTGNARGQYL